jgi:hypothetical protein
VSRLCRICVLMLALFSWSFAVIPANASGTSVTLRQGSLAISPSFLTVAYTASPAGTRRTVTSSFSVHVTDARGTGVGWDIRASVIATSGPNGGFPTGQQSITGVGITNSTGTRPILSAPSNALLPAQQIIARSASGSGIGQSTELFSTQLVLANGLPGGQYTATLRLFVTAIGNVNPSPGGRSSGANSAQGAPVSVPSGRTSQTTQGGPGPDPQPPTRLGPGAPSPSAGGPPATTDSRNDIPASGQSAGSSSTSAFSPTTGSSAAGAASASNASAAAPPVTNASNLASGGPAISAPATGSAAQLSVAAPSGGATDPTADNDGATAPGSVTLDLAPPDDLSILPQLTVPTTAQPYPVVTLDGETLTVTLPFVSALYDPAAGGALWHMQTTLIGGPTGKTAVWRINTTPIRTNLGQYFSAALDLAAGKATIALYPFNAVRDDSAQGMDGATLLVTIGAGP